MRKLFCGILSLICLFATPIPAQASAKPNYQPIYNEAINWGQCLSANGQTSHIGFCDTVWSAKEQEWVACPRCQRLTVNQKSVAAVNITGRIVGGTIFYYTSNYVYELKAPWNGQSIPRYRDIHIAIGDTVDYQLDGALIFVLVKGQPVPNESQL